MTKTLSLHTDNFIPADLLCTGDVFFDNGMYFEAKGPAVWQELGKYWAVRVEGRTQRRVISKNKSVELIDAGDSCYTY